MDLAEKIMELARKIEELATERTYVTWDYYTLKIEEAYRQLEDLIETI